MGDSAKGGEKDHHGAEEGQDPTGHLPHFVAEAAFPEPYGWTTSTLSTQHSALAQQAAE